MTTPAATTSSTTATPAATSSPAPAATAAPAAATTTTETPAPAAATTPPAADDKNSTATPAPAQDGTSGDTGAGEPGQSSDDGKPPEGENQEGQDQKEGQEVPAQAYEQALTGTMPEGVEVDKDALAAAAPILAKHKVPPEAMKELGPVLGSMLSKAVKQNADQHAQVVQGWHDKTVADHGKEGQEAFEKKTLAANRAIGKFFTTEERAALKHYGFGNMSGLFALAHQVGLQMGEDNSDLPSNASNTGESTLADDWYGKKS